MDGDMNSKAAVTRNLSENFYLAALKMESQVTRLSQSVLGFMNENYLYGMYDNHLFFNIY